MTRSFLAIASVALLLVSSAFVQASGQQDDKTLSPYFFVKSDDPSVDRLPLKATGAQVDIVGVIARVKVTQVYKNEGKRTLEAIYVFPGSTRAAVHGMKMTIGERVITAHIEERQEARRQYDDARQAGKTTSLLEQQRPNVFQMNVANIMPGDEIKVELTYTELLVPEAGVYEFVYPTVVGPRYTNRQAGDAPDSARWVQNPYLHQGEAPAMKFDFSARISAGMSLKEVVSPSHRVNIQFPDAHNASVALDPAEASGSNRDLVLRYRLTDDRIETGLLLSAGSDEQFFLCLVEPPKRFAPSSVPPREYVFVMDVSGSMHGFPLETSKALLRHLLGKLRSFDRFNVLFFSGGSYVLSPESLEATDENKTRALQEIEQQQGGGGTELLPALERAFSLPRARTETSRVVVVATDGYVDVEREAFTLVRNHLGDTNVFMFGIGTAVNRHLIEGMARVGEGLPFVVSNAGEADAAASRFLQYIESPLLTHVEVRATGFDAYDLEPAKFPDVFADRPLVLAGKYRGAPGGTITVTGFTGQGRFERRITVGHDSVSPGNDVIKYLWARERVALLSDFASVGAMNADTKQEVINLGLKYNLLTEFTSFVAVDQHVRRTDGQLETVKQPLPLPQGVSDLAVGDPGSVHGGGGGSFASMRMMAAPSAAPAMPYAAADAAKASGQYVATRVPEKGETGANQPRSSVVVDVLENHMVSAQATNAARLKALLSAALAGTHCTAFATSGGVRVKVSFDSRGKVNAIEVLDQLPKNAASAIQECVRAALLKMPAVPSVTGGYAVVRVSW